MFLISLSISAIMLNQAGFYPQAPKVAVITNSPAASKFYVITADKKDTVFSGNLSDEKQSTNSDTKTRIADFTKLTTKGSFVVNVPGIGNSPIFKISNDVGREVAIATLKGFYYQRVSMPLEEKYAGKWHRPAGHPDTVVYIHPSAADEKRPAGTVISSPGGWYDAGDYNKYIVNSGITMGTLLSAYEDFPAYYSKINTNIPESKDAIPDILNEVIYNLRWMLSMQDPNDGGVYNKCTNAAFDGMVMPGVTKAPRYVVQKGTAATLDFAAVTAQASRILKQYNKRLADSCLKAAEKAWEWAKLHPDMEYDQRNFQPAITTGPYGDKYFKDEWFWAGVELYITTKEEKYKPAIIDAGLPTWSNVAMLGYYTLLRFNKEPKLKEKIITMANGYATKLTAFQTVMGQSVRDFNWGSNSNAGNQGILLINAYKLTGDKKYLNLALSNLDYLLGRNATGYCFVTGIGTKSTMHPHHRPSVADGIKDPVPGLLAAGPNPGMQDKCKYEFTAPELAYSDIDCAYASNEITINWNAPIVYLANALEALKDNAGYTKRK
ncbi:cellulase [Chitinophaga sp. SYP-B3965]|uniref:glycoside hydrolase family 9 protein n=1 Tax=Chitinophaga sp. SYP-B3965 TaxID=2663120 RepID=UPI001299ADC0|nr:glycoside hydrolase family 9 protein [Chitinophaga sp. SYP-B3965]MRG48583.1 cellulase [Chitinophaga sp. SYP-B3965]